MFRAVLERHAEKWNRFSAKMPRKTKELERKADSTKRHFALALRAYCFQRCWCFALVYMRSGFCDLVREIPQNDRSEIALAGGLAAEVALYVITAETSYEFSLGFSFYTFCRDAKSKVPAEVDYRAQHALDDCCRVECLNK
jgi:hypothetical protein